MAEKETSIVGNWLLMDYVRKNSGLRKNAQLVAMHLAGNYYPEKGYSSITVQRLADATGLGKRTINFMIADIIASGEWKANKKNGCSTRYFPVIAKLAKKQPLFDATAPVISETDENDNHNAADSENTAVNQVSELPEPFDNTEILVAPNLLEAPFSTLQLSDLETPDSLEELLPLFDETYNSENTANKKANILRGIKDGTTKDYATRLHSRIPLATRRDKNSFTVEKLSALYQELTDVGYPLEAIDILMWVQCEDRDALNGKFLSLVLSRCVSGNQIVKPNYRDTTNPAMVKAFRVWEIYNQRQSTGGSKWVEFI